MEGSGFILLRIAGTSNCLYTELKPLYLPSPSVLSFDAYIVTAEGSCLNKVAKVEILT